MCFVWHCSVFPQLYFHCSFICIYKHFRIYFPSIIENLVILVGLSFFFNLENNDILWYWGILFKKRRLFNYLSPFLLKYLPDFEDMFSVLVHFNFILQVMGKLLFCQDCVSRGTLCFPLGIKINLLLKSPTGRQCHKKLLSVLPVKISLSTDC